VHTITHLAPEDFHDNLQGLAEILADAVADGSSLGFLSPFDRDAAAAWWRSQAPAVSGGSLLLWAARDGRGDVLGTVGLACPGKPNGRHRAEVVKLMVHRRARGRGLGRALLATAEEAAVRSGISLLMLDTESGSVAEHLYHAAGWTRYGVVPGYAADPAGTPRECSFFYKRLG
jgi:GNAT superfamily N-acetyltransferase